MSASIETQAFLLHKIDYSNTSNIGYFLTRDFGIISVMLRGSKRVGKGGSRAISAFLHTHFLMHYSGMGDMKNARSLDNIHIYSLKPRELIIMSYVHELLLQIFPKNLEIPSVFDKYKNLLDALSVDKELSSVSLKNIALKKLELEVLDYLGYPLVFEFELLSEEKISEDKNYFFYEKQGFISEENASNCSFDFSQGHIISGKSILEISRNEWNTDNMKVLQRCVREAISVHLKHQLNSRRVYEDILSLQNKN